MALCSHLNKAFAEWNQVFEGAACVATMVDRLCHRIELVKIDGPSFRATEAQARAAKRTAKRRPPPKKK